MTVKRLLALALTLLLALTALTGCENMILPPSSDTNAPADTDTDTEPTAAPIANDLSGFKADKIGSVDKKVSINLTESSGVIYEDRSGDIVKYGILTLDGKNDTGAKYTSCSAVEQYFEVSTATSLSVDDPSSLNCIGVVDANGNEVIPMQYASVKSINERFMQVTEVTERTDNEDEALVYYSSNTFSLTAGEDDPLFKGIWYIYDVTTGKKVPDASGTNRYILSAYGDCVKYTTDDQQDLLVNANGEPLPEDADMFENGLYSLSSGSEGAVYRGTDNTKLFDFDSSTGYNPIDSEGDYIVASKYADGAFKYVLMDTNGHVVSAEFDEHPYVYGELIHMNDTIVDLQGNILVDGTFGSVYEEECLGGAWFLRNDEEYTLVNKDGTVLFQGNEVEGLEFDPYTAFTVSKKIGDDRYCYCLKDNDFTIKGRSASAPWLVETTNDDYSYNVVEAMTGQTLIQGYESFRYVTAPGVGIYVYAYKDGGTDIYLVN